MVLSRLNDNKTKNLCIYEISPSMSFSYIRHLIETLDRNIIRLMITYKTVQGQLSTSL